MAGGDDRLAVADRRAVHPLERQHTLGGAIPVDGGRAIARIVAEILAQLLGRGGFHTKVHLDAHYVGEGADRLDRLQPAKARLRALDQFSHPVEEIEIALERRLDARSQHLDSDVTAVGRNGEMDLCDRGGGDRLIVETREQGVDRLAELALDRGARLASRKGRQMVLQPRQVGRDPFAQEIGAGRQRLAELDEARAHVLQRRRQPLARAAFVAARTEQPRPGDQCRRDAQDLQRKQGIVPREAEREPKQPPGIAQRAKHD